MVVCSPLARIWLTAQYSPARVRHTASPHEYRVDVHQYAMIGLTVRSWAPLVAHFQILMSAWRRAAGTESAMAGTGNEVGDEGRRICGRSSRRQQSEQARQPKKAEAGRRSCRQPCALVWEPRPLHRHSSLSRPLERWRQEVSVGRVRVLDPAAKTSRQRHSCLVAPPSAGSLGHLSVFLAPSPSPKHDCISWIGQCVLLPKSEKCQLELYLSSSPYDN